MSDDIIDFPDGPAPSPEPGAEDPSHLPSILALPLLVRDPDLIRELVKFSDSERVEFGMMALRIAVLALRQARGQIDSEAVKREGERIMAGIEADLKSHALQLDQTFTGTLRQYFDPQDGRFQERLDRLIRKDGELEEVLRRQIGSQDSVLSKTLVEHLGPGSALMKVLDPSQAKGLFSSIRKAVEDQLSSQRERVIKETKAGLSEVVREFSLDHKGSALSRLKAILDTTNRAINENLTLDREGSPLALLRRQLMEVLDRHAKADVEFQKELRSTMATIVTKRKEAERSPRHGLDFEDRVWEAVQAEAQAQGDIPELVGKTTGLIRGCKVGDVLVALGPESMSPESKVVIEVKAHAGFNLKRARKEIEVARKNRDAQAGLFVFSRKEAPEGLARLVRLGSDVFVVWDAEDPGDTILGAGLSVAKAVCFNTTRRRETAKAADFTAIDKAILEVEKQAKLLDDVSKYTATIRNASDKIAGQIGRAKEALEKQIEVLNDRIGDIKTALGGADEKAA